MAAMPKHRRSVINLRTLTMWLLLFCLLIGNCFNLQTYAAPESTDDWITVYTRFLQEKQFYNMGLDFGTDLMEEIGYFFDLDHDGIPELILHNGYDPRALRAGYAFGYNKGNIVFLGYGPTDAYITVGYDGQGYDGPLFGLYNSDNNDYKLNKYTKDGLKVSSEIYTQFENLSFTMGEHLVPLQNSTIPELIGSLNAMRNITSVVADPAAGIYELNQILSSLWGYFDYRTEKLEGSGLEQVLNVPSDFLYHFYFPDAIAYDSNYISYNTTWKGNRDYDLVLNGERTDWILKNVFNKNDAFFSNIRSNNPEGHIFYQNDYYYLERYNDWRSYTGTHVTDIEPLKVNGLYSIRYNYTRYTSGGVPSSEGTGYALAALKTIDGKKYWSLYMTGDEPLDDMADKIDLGMGPPRNYAPYKTIAIKALSNNCYVTCDIGAMTSGQYSNMENPDFNVNAAGIGAYEMFYLVPLSDGNYALQTIMSMKYIACDSGVGQTDFVEDKNKFTLENAAKGVIFHCQSYYFTVEEGKLKLTEDREKATVFSVETVSDNRYTDSENNILTSREWFHLTDGEGNQKDVGYWNIQNEIGRELNGTSSIRNVESLTELGYTPMYRRDLNGNNNKYIVEHDNMQCSIGVRIDADGIYDVIIAFQGTHGYSENNFLYNWQGDLGSNLTTGTGQSKTGSGTKLPCHAGYLNMAQKLLDVTNRDYSTVITKINGKEISLNELIKKASKGKARFTLLGHSMGGAIAQCFALLLLESNVPYSQIKGRTFNSALAFSADVTEVLPFDDWYNLCVTSDSVPRGLVQGSMKYYGRHYLGKTIWLYDNESDLNHKLVFLEYFGNIAGPKHNVDAKLKEILSFLNNNLTEGYTKVNSSEIFATNKANVPVYERPRKDADPVGTIAGENTIVQVDAYTYNNQGNKWYRLSDGRYIYAGNLSVYPRKSPGFSIFPSYLVNRSDAPVRAGFYQNCDMVVKLPKGTELSVDYSVKNNAGNYWYHVYADNYEGYIYSENVIRGLSGSALQQFKQLIEVGCPVNVSLYDASDRLVASIIDYECYTSDETRILPYTIGSGKFFAIADEEEYHITIEAYAYGMMEYHVYRDYDESTGEYASAAGYDAITLVTGSRFSGSTALNKKGQVELHPVNDRDEVIGSLTPEGFAVYNQASETVESRSEKTTNYKRYLYALAGSGIGLLVFGVFLLLFKKFSK